MVITRLNPQGTQIYQLECERCGVRHSTQAGTDDLTVLRRNARLSGWVVENDHDICRRCTEAVA